MVIETQNGSNSRRNSNQSSYRNRRRNNRRNFWTSDKRGVPGFQHRYEPLLIEKDTVGRLEVISQPAIKSFLHEFNVHRERHPGISIKSYLSMEVCQSLKNRGVNIHRTGEVIKFLKDYLAKGSESRKEFALQILKKELKWPLIKFQPLIVHKHINQYSLHLLE